MAITEDTLLRIVELRAGKGWTQSRLAEEAGITQSTLSRIESGVQEPRAQTLVKIADALDVEYRDLLASGKGPPGKQSGLVKLRMQIREIDWALEDLPVEKKAAILELIADHTRAEFMREILRDAVGRMDAGEIERVGDMLQFGEAHKK